MATVLIICYIYIYGVMCKYVFVKGITAEQMYETNMFEWIVKMKPLKGSSWAGTGLSISQLLHKDLPKCI